jgi:N utilization substance protein B
MRSRTRAREAALRYLFELDINEGKDRLPPGEYLESHSIPEESATYATVLIQGVLEDLGELNEVISSAALNWRLDRMAVIDRNLLRIGAWEVLKSPDVPGEVAINEAVDLAKRYGTSRSGSFVNGILDKILTTRNGASATEKGWTDAKPDQARPEEDRQDPHHGHP